MTAAKISAGLSNWHDKYSDIIHGHNTTKKLQEMKVKCKLTGNGWVPLLNDTHVNYLCLHSLFVSLKVCIIYLLKMKTTWRSQWKVCHGFYMYIDCKKGVLMKEDLWDLWELLFSPQYLLQDIEASSEIRWWQLLSQEASRRFRKRLMWTKF